MSNNTKESNTSSTFPVLGFFTFGLTATFIVLKAAGITAVADWSWVWVLSPLWICFSIGMGIIGLIVLISIIIFVICLVLYSF